jgi:hypothetical protein
MLPSRPRLRQGLIFRQVEDDFVVYDPVSDRTALLNVSLAAVLDLCDGTRTVPEITAEIAAAFRAAPETLSTQVGHALNELVLHSLLEPEGIAPA